MNQLNTHNYRIIICLLINSALSVISLHNDIILLISLILHALALFSVMMSDQHASNLPLNKVEGPLTSREYEILSYVAKGHTDAEIGKELSVSMTTVKSHLRNIFMKLDFQNRTQAAIYYMQEHEGM